MPSPLPISDEAPPRPPSLSGRTERAIQDVLSGQNVSRGPFGRILFARGLFAMAGPAIVASVAYVDPGNYVTNIQAGARYGYGLLWVVLLANLIAMVFQGLSARLGIVSGRNLAELCRERYPRAAVLPMWLAAELAAMATDLAEFVGGAIGLSLLAHIALLPAMGVMGVLTFLLLGLQSRGFRPIELVIAGLVAIISLSYLAELFIAPPRWAAALHGLLVPSLPDAGALGLAIGIVGATVMPHAIFLHSGLTQSRVVLRNEAERCRMVRFSDREVLVALSVAGLVNIAMVAMAARFHPGHAEVADLAGAYRTLTPLLGASAGILFLVSLLAAGLSSSLVATMAGQVVMQGFVGYAIPLWVRRSVTMLPSFVVIGIGVDPTWALIASQVVLSFVLPLPMITLLAISRDVRVMGVFRLTGRFYGLSLAMVAVVLGLNTALLAQTFGWLS
jgi:manganese transport protein